MRVALSCRGLYMYGAPRFKSLIKNRCFFYSARRQGFYFACVQLTIGGGRCHVTKQMRGTTVQKQKQISGKRNKYSSGLIPSSFSYRSV